MANGRNPKRPFKGHKIKGRFHALPARVVDCSAYLALSPSARSLLIEFLRQLNGINNGRLLATKDYLHKRGWKSSETITKSKRELLDAGFIYQTVKGKRPNKASNYAVTWLELEPSTDYDSPKDAERLDQPFVRFRMHAYDGELPVLPVNPVKSVKEILAEKTYRGLGTKKSQPDGTTPSDDSTSAEPVQPPRSTRRVLLVHETEECAP